MADLYPLLLLPEFHERPWGARHLAPIYDRRAEAEPIGEAWLTGDECRVANGPLQGQTLSELARRYGAELAGEAAPQAGRFPLLIKFLFPREKLSVQVHPDDEGARRIGEPCGKTECWYVVAADRGAQVGLGLKPGVTRADLGRAIAETRAEELLNWVELRPGDMVYVDAGTVHAIGPGSILVETQQNSDTTYRLYDYGRGRELHVREGLAATKEKTGAGKVVRAENAPAGGLQLAPGNARTPLVASPCFVVEKLVVQQPQEFHPPQGKTSAQIFVGLEGCGVVEAAGEAISFNRGECVVIPAALPEFTVRPQWTLECLRMMVPGGSVPAPETGI
jgi:mannose-6-phosphate isomerase